MAFLTLASMAFVSSSCMMKETFFIQVDINEAIPKKCDVICVGINYCFFEKFEGF